MRGLSLIGFFAGALVCPAQVLTQYLDFGSLGSAVFTTQDKPGNVYVVGSLANQSGIRVYKLSSSGAVLYRFDFRSGGGDYPTAAVVDQGGFLYVVGETSGKNFPLVHPLFPNVAIGASAGFLAKIDPTGTGLAFSTLLGGSAPPGPPLAQHYGTGIASVALDPSGNIYLGGWTTATDFPVTPGAYQRFGVRPGYNQLFGDFLVSVAFVVKIPSSLDRVAYSTLLSGNPNSGALADFVAADRDGVVTVAGLEGDDTSDVNSGPLQFPVTPGAYGNPQCAVCTFVTRLSADGSSLIWSAVIGGFLSDLHRGSFIDNPESFAVDGAGNVFFTGQTDNFFPVTPNALQPTAPNNMFVGFIGKLSSDGAKLTATFLGTASIASMNLDGEGNVWVAGSSEASGVLDQSLPVQPASAFFAELSPNLDKLLEAKVMPGYQDAAIAPPVDASAMLISPGGGVWLVPSTAAPGPAILDVSNSAASVYWTYLGNGVLPRVDIGPANWQYISPGAIISIYGSGLGPVGGAGAVFDVPGHIATSLAGVSVTFDDIPASLLYASAGQINAVAPFEIAGQPSTVMRIRTGAGPSGPITLPVLPATPFVFGYVAEPSNQYQVFNDPFASALNQDGTVNSAANRAKAGSVVSIFANGAGLYSPPLVNGTVNGANLISPTLPVTVFSVNQSATRQPLYAGTAPGLAAGILQVNFQLDTKTFGADQYRLMIGGYPSQTFTIYTAQ